MNTARRDRSWPKLPPHLWMICVALTLGLEPTALLAQTNEFLWALAVGGRTNELDAHVAADANGNSYLSGTFQSPSVNLGTNVLNQTGLNTMFLARLDAAGKVLWAKVVGGTNASSRDVVTDSSGNCYVLGYGTIITLGYGLFVQKYNAAGSKLWERRVGRTGFEYNARIALYRNNDVAVLKGDSLFRLSASEGIQSWSNRVVNLGSPMVNAMCTDGTNVYLAGAFSRTDVLLGTNLLSNPTDSQCLLLAQCVGSGVVAWAKRSSGTPDDRAHAIAADALGNLYVAGDFGRNVLTYGNVSITNAGGLDLYLLKCTPRGEGLWGRRGGGSLSDSAAAVTLDKSGRCLVAGYLGSQSSSFDGVFIDNQGLIDMFAAKYDSAGNLLWLTSTGEDKQRASVSSVKEDSQGNAFFAGQFLPPAFTCGQLTLTNAGSNDIFVARRASAVLPVIENPPESLTSLAGLPVTLTVSAQGPVPITFQWQKDGMALPDATNASLQFEWLDPTNSGSYQVVVSNFHGAVTSEAADLHVLPFGYPVVVANNFIGSPLEFTNEMSVIVAIESMFGDARIFYTLDGQMPDLASTYYSGPFTVTQSVVVTALVFDSNFNSSTTNSPVRINLWREHTLTVATNQGGQVLLDPPGGVYRNDAVVRLTAIADPGAVFLHWTQDASGSATNTTVSMERNKTVAAVFATSVRTRAIGSGSIQLQPALPYYRYGSIIHVQADPGTNAFFAAWGGSASGNASPLVYTVSSTAPEISGVFSTLPPGKVALTVRLDGWGMATTAPAGNVFSTGTVVTVKATPDTTNTFLGWTGSVSERSNALKLTLETNMTLMAHFGARFTFACQPLASSNALQFTLTGDRGRVCRILTNTVLNTRLWSHHRWVTNMTGTQSWTEHRLIHTPMLFYRAAQDLPQ